TTQNEAKLALLEAAVSQYKELRDSKNDLYSSNETLENQIQKLKARIESSKELFQLKDRIEHELSRYSSIEDSNQKVNEIKNKRFALITNLLIKLQNIISDSSKSENNTVSDNNTSTMYGVFMLLPLPFVIVISTILFIRTSQVQHVVLGSIIFLLNLIFFFLVNLYSEVRIFNSSLFSIDYNNTNTNIYQQFVKKLSNRENEFLVNAAWVDALKTERSKILETIEKRMGGKSFIEIDAELKKLQEEIENNNSNINKKVDGLIDAEEYLKIRRELDLLKIDNPSITAPDSLNIKFIGLSNLEERLKGTIMSYIEYLKQNQIASVVME
ncbi:hypothetical protein KC669_04715, partial [Candidatus Dojkabacteria bacterium]|nr:hypothetical protein [Candidatus Dojkabacteria bacterium]